jgi:prolyl-tRNA editing enzyme YbaK/EbsC (Cys-tRNA(Pro) deacylase)
MATSTDTGNTANASGMSANASGNAEAAAAQSEGFQRVSAALAALGHPHAPRWLTVAARTSQEAADALGILVGQVAKSIIFRRAADDAVVLVITSGDKRVDEHKVTAITGPLKRADASFVKQGTGFSIGGVAPLAHATPAGCELVTLIDRELFRFETVWAAAGHPNGVFPLTPAQLQQITGAPVHDVVVAAS